MDMTREKIESEILKWDRRRAEAVRLHNACAIDEQEMRNILWCWVKTYESFIGSLRECLSLHIANKTFTGGEPAAGETYSGRTGST